MSSDPEAPLNLGLEDKVFVVVGGSRGLGFEVARELVAEGARVLLAARGLEALEAAAAELGELAVPCVVDLADPEDAGRVGGLAAVLLGGIDGVFVGVGSPPHGEALQLTDAEWLGAFDLTVRGPLALLRGVVPLLEEEGGSILFLTCSSEAQLVPEPASSNVLRPGVASLVKSLARELAPAIRVNSIAPGGFDTDRVRALDARPVAGIPLGRNGEPAELGRVAAFLLSPAASYLTGAAIQVDGGAVSAVP